MMVSALVSVAVDKIAVETLEEVFHIEAMLGDEVKITTEQLQAVVDEGTDAAALEHAIILARAVPLEKPVIDHAVERLREIYVDTERQKRREALGLGSLELPNEFMCPLTLDKMRGMPLPPHSPLASHAALPQRLPSLRHRPGGGIRRPLIRAVGHPQVVP